MLKLCAVLALLLLFSLRVWSADRVTGQPFATRSEVLATGGMAATSQPLATQVALDILKSGGNAAHGWMWCWHGSIPKE